MVGLRCPCITAGSAAPRYRAVSPQRAGDEAGSALEVAAETPQGPACAAGGAGRARALEPALSRTGVSKLARSCQCENIPGMQPPPPFRSLPPGY